MLQCNLHIMLSHYKKRGKPLKAAGRLKNHKIIDDKEKQNHNLSVNRYVL